MEPSHTLESDFGEETAANGEVKSPETINKDKEKTKRKFSLFGREDAGTERYEVFLFFISNILKRHLTMNRSRAKSISSIKKMRFGFGKMDDETEEDRAFIEK